MRLSSVTNSVEEAGEWRKLIQGKMAPYTIIG